MYGEELLFQLPRLYLVTVDWTWTQISNSVPADVYMQFTSYGSCENNGIIYPQGTPVTGTMTTHGMLEGMFYPGNPGAYTYDDFLGLFHNMGTNQFVTALSPSAFINRTDYSGSGSISVDVSYTMTIRRLYL